MSSISFTAITDGSTIDASDVNGPLNTIYDDYNGSIDSNNLADNAVTTAKITDANVTTAKIADDNVTDAKLDYPRWWQEIARTTLTEAGDTITVSSIPARKYLRIIFSAVATEGTTDSSFFFNNDGAGTTYSYTYSAGWAPASPSASQAKVPFDSGATDSGQMESGYVEVIGNISTQEKNFIYFGISQDAAGAATQATQLQGFGKWANTSAQITRVDFTNAGTGNYAIGSEVIVLGHD